MTAALCRGPLFIGLKPDSKQLMRSAYQRVRGDHSRWTGIIIRQRLADRRNVHWRGTVATDGTSIWSSECVSGPSEKPFLEVVNYVVASWRVYRFVYVLPIKVSVPGGGGFSSIDVWSQPHVYKRTSVARFVPFDFFFFFFYYGFDNFWYHHAFSNFYLWICNRYLKAAVVWKKHRFGVIVEASNFRIVISTGCFQVVHKIVKSIKFQVVHKVVKSTKFHAVHKVVKSIKFQAIHKVVKLSIVYKVL